MSTDPIVPTSDLTETRHFEDAPMAESASVSADAEPTASAPLPRTRWAAIVWGACFAAIAWFGIWMLSSVGRRGDVTDWFASLNPGTITALALLSVGVLVLITGAVGLMRRVQLRRRSHP